MTGRAADAGSGTHPAHQPTPLSRRVGWLLRSCRVYGPDTDSRVAARFADRYAELAAAEGGEAAAPGDVASYRSQVSRWESGASRPSYTAVRRYERVLGLRPRLLTAGIDRMARSWQPLAARPYLRGDLLEGDRADEVADRLDELLELCLSNDPVDAGTWDDLGRLLASLPEAFLRRRDWERLVSRGVEELAVSTGLSYLLRVEAMARLATHPIGGPHLVRHIDALVRDPSTQAVADTMTMLQYSPLPAAGDAVLHQLRSPTSESALRAALFTVATITATGQLDAGRATEAAHLALGWLRDNGVSHRVQRCAADVLRAQPAAVRRRLAAALSRDQVGDTAVAVLTEDVPLPRESASRLRGDVTTHLVQRLGSRVAGDLVLRELLDQALLEPNDEQRGAALCVFMVSPLGVVLGTVLAAEVADAVGRADLDAAHEALVPLSFLAQPSALGLLTDLATGSALGDLSLAAEAGWALGNMTERRGPEAVQRDHRIVAALERHVTAQPARPMPTEALTYALGMRRRTDLVVDLRDRLAAHGPVPAPLEEALRWWLSRPSYVVPGDPH